MRGLVDQLTAVHDGNREWGAYLRRHGGTGNVWDGKQVTEPAPVEHPVVRVHPESGRKGLFVNPGFTSHVVGVSDAESRALLDLLYAHLTKPEHTVRHRWQVGDVGIWDNRSTLHYANRDYTRTRVMARVTIRGDRPAGRRRRRTRLTRCVRPQQTPTPTKETRCPSPTSCSPTTRPTPPSSSGPLHPRPRSTSRCSPA